MQAAPTDVALWSIGTHHTPLDAQVNALAPPIALALIILRSIVAVVAG